MNFLLKFAVPKNDLSSRRFCGLGQSLIAETLSSATFTPSVETTYPKKSTSKTLNTHFFNFANKRFFFKRRKTSRTCSVWVLESSENIKMSSKYIKTDTPSKSLKTSFIIP